MKNVVISALVFSICLVLAGCRGSNSTYTTAITETTVTTQAETPTINNGNGPITTAPTDNATKTTIGAETGNENNNANMTVESDTVQTNTDTSATTK